ncbi:MAG: NAD-dependent epimerase/dehydratase family protein, partial [Alphaproteobacteria bacterium]
MKHGSVSTAKEAGVNKEPEGLPAGRVTHRKAAGGRFLVTGANGFVGSAVVRALMRRGHRVRVLLRPESDTRNLEGLFLERVTGDLRDRDARSAALEGVDGVFHVAADYRLWVRDPASMYAINVDATRALLEEAWKGGVKRIVHTSSVATIGRPSSGDIADERCEARIEEMVGHYKRSKYLGELAARELAGDGAPIVIVNPSTPLGPRDVRPTPTGRVLIEAARGRIPAYVETGLNIAHVDD